MFSALAARVRILLAVAGRQAGRARLRFQAGAARALPTGRGWWPTQWQLELEVLTSARLSQGPWTPSAGSDLTLTGKSGARACQWPAPCSVCASDDAPLTRLKFAHVSTMVMAGAQFPSKQKTSFPQTLKGFLRASISVARSARSSRCFRPTGR